MNINFAEKLKANDNLVSRSTSSNVGYFFLQYIYKQLNIQKFFEDVTADLKITFDPNTVNRFLTFSRILNPTSKLGTCSHLDMYYEKPDTGYMHIMRTLDIRKFNSMGGRAFIVTQSIKKLSKPLQEAVFNDSGYKLLSDNTDVSVDGLKSFDKKDVKNKKLYTDKAYKVITADRAIDIGLYETQHIIITFSRKAMEYQRYIRGKQIERAKKLLKNIDPETPNDVTRFIKRTSGSAVDTFEIDEDVIAKEEMYDGYYAIATNLDDSAKDIIEISPNRYKTEDCFRTMKTNFSVRPIFIRKRSRLQHISWHSIQHCCYFDY